MAALALETPLRRGPVLWRRSGDQVMIRRRGIDQLVVLAGTGVALWDGLATPTTLGALVEDLAAAHGAPPETVDRDVRAALASLIADDVVVSP